VNRDPRLRNSRKLRRLEIMPNPSMESLKSPSVSRAYKKKAGGDTYRIILADDHVMVRQGIRNLLEKMEDLQVIGEVNNGLELLGFLKTSVPDLILLDLAMPKLRGLEALREVKKGYPGVKILILTMHGSEEFVRQAAINRADGFILKEEPIGELIRGIRAIRTGKKYFSSGLSKALLSMSREGDHPASLSGREKEVLQCLAKGMSVQKISDSLFISVHTVRRHRYNIMQKLGRKNMADLTRYAIAKGYID
jgi:DNA-binding NarL/FixJ family response regulator